MTSFQDRLGESRSSIFFNFGGWRDSNPRSKNPWSVYTTPFVKGLEGNSPFGYACKRRLTNHLPKASLTTLGRVAVRPDIRADMPMSTRCHFLGIPGRVFFKFYVGKVASLVVVDGGIRTHGPNSLPKLSLLHIPK